MIYAVVLAEGHGTKLWPLSRETLPTQFIDFGRSGKSLFEDALENVKSFFQEDKIILSINETEETRAKTNLRDLHMSRVKVLQPFPKDAVTALGLAAWYVDSISDNAAVIALPCSVGLMEQDLFQNLMSLLVKHIKSENTVILGSKEAPSGVLAVKASYLKKQYRKHLPKLAAQLDSKGKQARKIHLEEDFLSFEALLQEPDNPIYLDPCASIPKLNNWNDYLNFSHKDPLGNRFEGPVIALDTRNTLGYSNKHLLGLVGLKDLVVIATEDAILVTSLEKADEVKTLVKSINTPERLEHPTVYRPWGSYTVLVDDDYKVKKLVVNVGSRLSLQSHRRRKEHWIVSKGDATVTLDDDVLLYPEESYIFIPLGTKHRLENKGPGILEIIEVQQGDYFGEDDIIRYQDDYGRTL